MQVSSGDLLEDAHVWNDVHGEGEGDVRIAAQAGTVIEKVVLVVLVSQFQPVVAVAQHDVVPEHNLIDGVLLGLVMSGQVEKQLLGVPVERSTKVGVQIELEEAELADLSIVAEIGHVLNVLIDRLNAHLHRLLVRLQQRGQKAADGHRRQNGQCEGEHRVRSG